MEIKEILTLDEKKLLLELLKRTLKERKPIFDSYQKYIEKREKLAKEKSNSENNNTKKND